MNLADIPDKDCFKESNVEAAIGTLVMKHAFDEDQLRDVMNTLDKMLLKLDNEARATLVEKIQLYLGEYIDEDVLEELRMRKSIGQVLGIKTAGDRRRAAERAGLRRGLKKGREKGAADERSKNEAANALRDNLRAKFLRSQNIPEDVISAMLAIK